MLRGDYEQDRRWITLSAARQEQALKRLRAIRWYKDNDDHSVQAAENAAEKAGISLRLFYKILKEWDAAVEPTIWLLVPYAGRRTGNRSALEPEVKGKLHELILAALQQGMRSRGEIAAAVADAWPSGNLRRPARNTILRHVADLAGDVLFEKGAVSPPARATVTSQRVSRHGEVLIIDHVTLQLFADRDGEPVPIILTIAIDVFTATIAGFQTFAAPPSALAARAALMHAQHESQRNPGDILVPNVVLNATNGRDWRNLVSRLAAAGVEADVRWGSRLHTGVFARQYIGSQIGSLSISPRVQKQAGLRRQIFDPRRHALVTPHKAELLVAAEVSEFNLQRMPAGISLSRIQFPDLRPKPY